MVKLANTPIIRFKKDKKALVLQSMKGKDESSLRSGSQRKESLHETPCFSVFTRSLRGREI